jgi:Cu-processing system permease protein
MMRTLRQGFAVLGFTLRTLVRERILYNVFFVALGLLAIGYLASKLVYGRQDRVILDIGAAAIELCLVFVASVLGSRLIPSEVESRLAYLILARPVHRSTYLFGRIFGLCALLALNAFLLFTVLVISVAILGRSPEWVFFEGAFLVSVHVAWIAAFTVFLSTLVSSAVAVMATWGMYFISQNLHLLRGLKDGPPPELVDLLTRLLPQGAPFALESRLSYGVPLSGIEFISTVGYGLMWVGVFSLLALWRFDRKSL